MQWHYAVQGREHGPVSLEALVSLAREGQIRADDLVWNPEIGNQWVKASTVPELAAVLASPAPGSESLADTFTGRTHNRDLMAQAKESLGGAWGRAVGVFLVAILILLLISSIPIVGPIAQLLIGGPIVLGLAILFLATVRKAPSRFGMLFDGFNRYGTALGAYLLMGLIVCLLLLLLIVPGILAALSYSMTYYVIADHPELGVWASMKRSKQMMRGNRWKFFCLGWRFFGWALLCVLTLGIGFLWLGPYMNASCARFYDDLRAGRNATPAA